MGGCVANSFSIKESRLGVEKYKWAVAGLIWAGNRVSREIFLSADASAFDFPLNADPEASARNSRLREIASCTNIAVRGVAIARIRPMIAR